MGKDFPSLRSSVSPRVSSIYILYQELRAEEGPVHPMTARAMSGWSPRWELDTDGVAEPGSLCTKGC